MTARPALLQHRVRGLKVKHSCKPFPSLDMAVTGLHTHTRREVTKEPSTNPLWIDKQAGQGTGRQQLVKPIKTKQSWLFEG